MQQRIQDIVRSCSRLATALEPLLKDPESAMLIARNLADIKPELAELDKLLSDVERTGVMEESQLQHIYQFLCIHWMYHACEIKHVIERTTKGAARVSP